MAILASKGARYLVDRDGDVDYAFASGPKGTKFVGTRKEGVGYIDETFVLDEHYFVYSEESIEPEVIETRNGYFILDASTMQLGLYVGNIDNAAYGYEPDPSLAFRIE